MIAAILILLILPISERNLVRGNAFRILSKFLYGFFLCNFVLLGILGQEHVEAPFIVLGQISTALYFLFFILFLPLLSSIENIFSDLVINHNEKV